MRSTDAKNKRWINFKVGVFRRNIFRVHRDKKIFFFFSIDKLDHAVLDKEREIDLLVREFLQILGCNNGLAIFEHDKRTPCAASVCQDDDVTVKFLVGYVHF